MAFGGPYYQRKALTGTPYGQPAVNIQRPRAIELGEVSERYGEMGGGAKETNASSQRSLQEGVGGGEFQFSPMTGTVEETGWRDIAHVTTGLVAPSSSYPSLNAPAKGVSGLAKAGVSYATGSSMLGTMFGIAVRGLIGPLLATAFPSLASKGYGALQTEYSPVADYGPSSGYSPGPDSFDPSADVGKGSDYAAPGGYDPAGGLTTGLASSDLSVADAMGMLGGGDDSGFDFGGWGGGTDS